MATDWSWVSEVGSAVGSIVKNINWGKKGKSSKSGSGSSGSVSTADYIRDSSGDVPPGQEFIPSVPIPSGMYVGVDNKVYSSNPKPTLLGGSKLGMRGNADNMDELRKRYDVVGKHPNGEDLYLLKPQFRVQPMNPQPTIQSSKNTSGMGGAVGSFLGGLLGAFGGSGSGSGSGGKGSDTLGQKVVKFLGDALPFALLGGVGYFGYKWYKTRK